MNKAYDDFLEVSKIPLSSIGLTPVILEHSKKDLFYDALDTTLNGLAQTYNSRHKVMNSHELKILEKVCIHSTIEVPSQGEYLARPDGFLLEDGSYKIIEMNYGNSMGGILAIYYLQQLYAAIAPAIDSGNLARGLVELWKVYSGAENKEVIAHRNCGGYERYEKQNEVLCEILRSYGLNIKFMDLKMVLKLLKENVISPALLISRQDILDDEESAALILELEKYAADNKVSDFNPVTKTDVFNSKILLALFSEYSNPNYLVDTFWLGNNESLGEEKFSRRINHLKTNQSRYLIKRDFSYQGKHVVFGDELSKQDWENAIEKALAEGLWVAQKIQRGRLLPLSHTELGNKNLPSVISPFVFGSNVAGVVVRYRLSETEKVCVLPNNSKTILGLVGFSNVV